MDLLISVTQEPTIKFNYLISNMPTGSRNLIYLKQSYYLPPPPHIYVCTPSSISLCICTRSLLTVFAVSAYRFISFHFVVIPYSIFFLGSVPCNSVVESK